MTDIEDMSFMAVAAMAKAIAGDPTYALLAESHSHGNTGVRSGEATDNSKYWSERSRDAASDAQDCADQAQATLDLVEDAIDNTVPQVTYDPLTGHLKYTGSNINLVIDPTDGHLYYEFTT